jgi:ubiquinol-cytochrome c reductase cytochrome c subunit
MRRLQMLALVLGAALADAGSVAGQAQPPAQPGTKTATAPAGNADNGRKLFVSYGCYQCHGYEGQGSSATGPRLAGRLMPFAGFSMYVREPAGVMPPYAAAVVPDADLRHIYEFLRTRPAPPPVQSIPQLR